MLYYNIKTPSEVVSLEQAVIDGVSEDGGLFMPQSIVRLPQAFVRNMGHMTLQEIAFAIANFAFQGDIDASVLRNIVQDTLNFDIPLHRVDDNHYVLELFHGPTMAFKDVGTRFMARLLHYYRSLHHQWPTIHVLVATSGDTGAAVANSFVGVPGVHIHVLYPHESLSYVQEAQFATLGDNVTALEVNGSFDDCKRLVNKAFVDPELNETLHMTSATSINVARILPQTFYYFYAIAMLSRQGVDVSDVVFSVPSANLGNLTSGLMARAMGLPVKRFVSVENENNIFYNYIKTGYFIAKPSVPSIAPALDAGNPTNMPRVMELLGNYAEIRRMIHAYTYNDEMIIDTIRDTDRRHGYLLDPHSAFAWQGLCDDLRPGEVGVSLATAHPAKFAATVEHATGHEVAMPPQLLRYLNGTRRVTPINNGYTSFKRYLLGYTNPNP